MPSIALAHDFDWTGWRAATRACVLAGIAPDAVTWRIGGAGDPLPDAFGGFGIARSLVDLATLAFQARAPDRFGVLYALVWRAHRGEPVLADPDDSDGRLARLWAYAVRTDAHRMRTHIRFLPVSGDSGPLFLGWYAPEHFVLEANARLLARRFPGQPMAIVTPDATALPDPYGIRFGPGLAAPENDETLRGWWEAHAAAIRTESRQGGGLPEAESLDESPRPPDRPPLGPVVPRRGASQPASHLAREAHGCVRCALHGPAAQTVFGEGPGDARIMLVGEQPGDQEDVIGRPFVGPAGQLLDLALEEAGIDRRDVYVTNAVKHFKFTERGRRRIHQSPSPDEIAICRFWLDAERAAVKPGLLVLLGASAGRAVLGRPVTVTRERGRPFDLPDGGRAFLTVHPSFLLRQPDDAAYAREYAAFVRDLRAVQALIAQAAD